MGGGCDIEHRTAHAVIVHQLMVGHVRSRQCRKPDGT
jgi:hypothetical protein